MKFYLLMFTAVSLAVPAFADYNCRIEALEAGHAILKLNSKGQSIQLSENQMGLLLGEKGVYAIGMTGLIKEQVNSIRVDFVSSESCVVKMIRIESRGW